MESELGAVLREQQALLSLLLNRVALVDELEKQCALDAYAEALWSHLTLWRSVLLPAAGDSDLARQVLASGTMAAQILSCAQNEQQRIAGRRDIQMLVRSLLSLLSLENALLRTTFSAFPEPLQAVLAGRSEQEFMRFGGLLDLNDHREEPLECD